ncbi:MAG: FMN-binding negative transcriptional regulator [Gemmatimonadota bacterium]|nr:FMN-binding negative transcriptional regulator [Gemmatimonadota bacterium]
MYVPRSNAEDRLEVLHDYIRGNPLATLVTVTASGMIASHLPLVLDPTAGPYGALQGHLARANPQHAATLLKPDALAIFSGPDAYITPSWYPAKAEHGKVVPTWNYVAVHAYGPIRFIDDLKFLRAHLESLVTRHESTRDHPWSVSDAPPEYIGQLERAIIGFEIPIARIEGKWKMSQNRSAADIDGVVVGLNESHKADDRAVAAIVQRVRPQPAD